MNEPDTFARFWQRLACIFLALAFVLAPLVALYVWRTQPKADSLDPFFWALQAFLGCFFLAFTCQGVVILRDIWEGS